MPTAQNSKLTKRFSIKKSFSKVLVFDQEADDKLLHQLWENPDSLIGKGDKLVEKDCVRTTVRLESDFQCFVVKRHVERSWRHFAKQCVSLSRAEKCWNDSWFLYDNGYPTPRPVAYLENRFGVLRGNSFFVYQYVNGTTLKQKATGLNNQRLIRKYIVQLAEIWNQHARLKVNLSDGHPANFLVDPMEKIWVIDLDKLQRFSRSTEAIPQLQHSYEQTLRGVFWDPSILDFGRRTFQIVLNSNKRIAA